MRVEQVERGRRMAKKSPPKVKKKLEKAQVSCLRSDCYQVLSENNVADPKKEPKLPKETLLKIYKNMAFTRAFDERGMMLQRQGRIGFYVPSFGQEAIQTGVCAALLDKDWVFPSYREPGVFLYRGADPKKLLANLWGNTQDICKGRQMPVHYSYRDIKVFSVSSPISTQVVQAVGAAVAGQIRKTKEVAATFFGDGGTSENDFHTGMTFAGVYKAPVVFICTNNQYAISVPTSKQTAARGIVDKAIGYGMPGVAVDGNDVLAVYSKTAEAVERARRGEGPTFIECVTLRMGPHSSSDDPTRYRDEKVYEAWKKRDPIQKFGEYLVTKKLWSEKAEKALKEEMKEALAVAVEDVEKAPLPDIGEIFTDVFKEMTPQLRAQQEALIKEGELRGKFENTSEAFPL